jgi:sigma-B regulation protein RsbU (phosphoserine phosphatase)
MKTTNESSITENVKPENYRFYKITQRAYILGAVGHLVAGFLFLWLKVYEMVWFNFIFSVPVFVFSYFINRKGRHGLAFSFAFIEILFHQIGAVYFAGWATGMQYWLIYLAGLTFFNAYWRKAVRICLISIISSTYVILYLFCRTSAVYVLSEPVYDFLFLNSILSTILSLSLLINYYVQAANKAENHLKAANQQLSEKNTQIEQALDDRNKALTQLNKELAEAADYVRSILPQPLTEGGIRTDWRYIPSTSLGGDSFGYHMVDQDHFAIYLIDVSGHGVGAALLSVSVMNVLRSQSLAGTDFKDPEQVLTSLNAAFPGDENNDMFFTIWYGIYNKSTRELAYASGGHPPALFYDGIHTDGANATFLRTANNAIGAMPNVSYEKSKHLVGEQTRLYLFSDGVYEVEKSDGSMWQFNEFTEFMSNIDSDNQSRLDRLHKHAAHINSLDTFEDDFTIVEVAFN